MTAMTHKPSQLRQRIDGHARLTTGPQSQSVIHRPVRQVTSASQPVRAVSANPDRSAVTQRQSAIYWDWSAYNLLCWLSIFIGAIASVLLFCDLLFAWPFHRVHTPFDIVFGLCTVTIAIMAVDLLKKRFKPGISNSKKRSSKKGSGYLKK